MAFDQAESDLFRIENELRERYPELELVTALGDIRESDTAVGGVAATGGGSGLPRGGVQACAHDGVARSGGGSQQRSGDLEPGARSPRPERAQPADDLFGQGGEPDLRDGRNQTRLRADRLRALAGEWADQVCFGALRKRSGQQRECGPRFSGADCRGRAAQGDSPGGAPVLHDDLGSGVPGGPGFDQERGLARFSFWTWANRSALWIWPRT